MMLSNCVIVGSTKYVKKNLVGCIYYTSDTHEVYSVIEIRIILIFAKLQCI